MTDSTDPVQRRDAASPELSEVDAGSPDAEASHEADTFERLLIADGLTPVVHMVEASSGERLASFGLTAVARVYRGALGRYGYAVQGDGNRVQIFDSGLVLEDHGDHLHPERSAPALLPLVLQGARPVHFVGHGAQVATFFDDDGAAHVLDERSLLTGAPEIVELDTGMAQHGVALAFGAGFLASVPELVLPATRAAPTGVAAYDAAGAATGEAFGGCPGLHGEAALDDVAAFGCSDGVLVVERRETLSARKLANPATTSSPAPRVGTLVAHPAVAHMIGNFGADQLCVVDLIANEIRPITVPAPYLQFGFDARGEHLLLLAKSGRLHVLDPDDLSEVAALDVTQAPTDDSGHGARYPQFAVGEHHVYVTDPENGKVTAVELGELTIEHDVRVPGHPTKIAVLSSAGH